MEIKKNWKLNDTVKPEDLNRIEGNIEELQSGIPEENFTSEEKQKLQSIEVNSIVTKKEVSDLINEEKRIRANVDNKSISTAEGVHGIRYFKNALQVLKGSKWEDIASLSGGDIGFSLGCGELEDFEFEVGEFVNAGAGWNRCLLNRGYEGIPKVFFKALDFDGIVLVKNIENNSFQYCLKKYTLSDSVTFPALTTQNVSSGYRIQYLAVYFGGEY